MKSICWRSEAALTVACLAGGGALGVLALGRKDVDMLHVSICLWMLATLVLAWGLVAVSLRKQVDKVVALEDEYWEKGVKPLSCPLCGEEVTFVDEGICWDGNAYTWKPETVGHRFKVGGEHRRFGFTLVELIVVMGIIIVLAALTLAVAPRLREDHKVTRGADQVQGWLFVAKQRANRSTKTPTGITSPYGLRLVRSAADPNQCRELLYVERPEEFRGSTGLPGGAGAVAACPSPYDPGNLASVFVQRVDTTLPPLWLENTLQPGDWLCFDALPTCNHRIASVTNFKNGTVLTLGAGDGTPCPIPAPGFQDEAGWHVDRQMQPLAGEAVLQLPKDVFIDLTKSLLPGAGMTSTDVGDNYLDVVFNPKGGLYGINSLSGTVVLWVRSATTRYEALVAVYRTGFIAVHPPGPDPANPFQYVLDGRNSGM